MELRFELKSDTAALLEASGSVLVLRDTTPPVEMLSVLRESAGSPGEVRASLSIVNHPATEATVHRAALQGAPAEWAGAVLIAIDAVGDIEFAAGARSGTALPSEWLTNASFVFIDESKLPFEWLALLPAGIVPLHRLLRSVGKKRLLRAAGRIRLLAKD